MKKITSILIILLLMLFGIIILLKSSYIMSSVTYSFDIWIKNIFPSLFPFFVLSDILINYGFVELLSELFKPIFEKFFKINGNASFIFFMSLLSGFPSNAKYTKELLNQGKINEKEATKILMFSHFSNPLFILGTVSITFLNDKKIGLIILISHYISNIIIALIFRNYNKSDIKNSKFSIINAIDKMHNKRINNNKKIGVIIGDAIKNTIDTLLLILGVVTTFLIITTIIDNILHPSSLNKVFISGILEMTQGLKYVSLLNIPIYYKGILITSILSFGGLSVHIQIISIISDTKIKYLPFLIARLFHVIISSFIFIILVKIFIYI